MFFYSIFEIDFCWEERKRQTYIFLFNFEGHVSNICFFFLCPDSRMNEANNH